jgi:hypothetical protein
MDFIWKIKETKKEKATEKSIYKRIRRKD